MAAPFEYVDLMEGYIKSLEARNSKLDPTGKLNEVRIPPERQQQAASPPQFYNADQHYATPRL
ncbi:hypothetical protein ABVK25_000011 [Lepraria finkii]|uniref:Uncharacterized protein n=1 Tax=Lepraria finkii TaxID=1340010 RepID=A0ABR4BLU6_9LECA